MTGKIIPHAGTSIPIHAQEPRRSDVLQSTRNKTPDSYRKSGFNSDMIFMELS